MKKEELRSLVVGYGDAIITFRSEKSKKLRYNVCTLDFTTPHIKDRKTKARAVETEDTLLMFCWDTDSYRLIKPASVVSVVPLSAVLKNH